MKRLKGKVAIITGAASGMGEATAKLFAQEGAKVVITDLQKKLLDKVATEIITDGGEVLAIKQDVASLDDWKKVVAQTIKTFDKIDILINNAGVTGLISQKIEDVTDATWDFILNINTKGPFYGVREVIPHMKKNGGGSIVNIGSIAGITGVGNAAYNSSKGALRLLTKNVALDYGKDNIRLNSILPGGVATPMIKDMTSNDAVNEQMIASVPLHTLGVPEDIAYAILYFASDESKFVTGAELVMDGGFTLD